MAAQTPIDLDVLDSGLVQRGVESPSALELLELLHQTDGPFVSLYLGGADGPSRFARWRRLRVELLGSNPPSDVVDSIERLLGRPAPDGAAGICVIAAPDGTTVVDHHHEAPTRDSAVFDVLPFSAPLLEWDQRRPAHVVVAADPAAHRIRSFGAGRRVDHCSARATPTLRRESSSKKPARSAPNLSFWLASRRSLRSSPRYSTVACRLGAGLPRVDHWNPMSFGPLSTILCTLTLPERCGRNSVTTATGEQIPKSWPTRSLPCAAVTPKVCW